MLSSCACKRSCCSTRSIAAAIIKTLVKRDTFLMSVALYLGQGDHVGIVVQTEQRRIAALVYVGVLNALVWM